MYVVATTTTALALFSLVLLRRLETLYRKDVYRDLEVQIPNEVDIQLVIEAVKKQRSYDHSSSAWNVTMKLK